MTPTGPFWAASSQQLQWAHMGTTRAKKSSLHGVFCWAEKGCSEQLAVLLHAAHLQGTSGAWRVTPVFSWGMSCQSSSGAAQPWVCQLPNGAAVAMCLLAELLGTQKPQWRLQCANGGTSHTFREVSGGWLTPQLSGPRQKPKPRVLAFTWELLHRQSKLNTPITKRDRGFFGWDCFQKRWTSLKILVFISFTVYSTVYCKNIHLLLFMWTKVSEGKCTNRSAHNPAPCFKMESFTTLVKIRCRPQLRRYMYICIYMKETDIWLWFSGKWSVSLSKAAAREARLLVFNLGSLYWVCIFMQSFGKLGVAVMKKKVSIKKFR